MSGIMNLLAVNAYTPFTLTDALLYVDAAQSSSYSGSGTTWTDISGNTNDGTIVNSPPYTSLAYGGYFTFNGTGSQYVSTTASKFNTAYTGKTVIVAARITAGSFSTGSFRCMFGTNGGTRNFNFYINYTGSAYRMHFSAGSGGGFSNDLSLTAGQWAVFAVTQTTGGLVTYYLNGVAVGTNTGVTFIQYASNSGEYIGLGDNYWYGDISMCAVYKRAMNSSEILEQYNSIKDRFSYTTSGLQLHYNPANISSYSGTGTTINDLSGNGLSGTMSNITYTSPYFAYNGTSSQVSIPDNALLEPGSGDFTMEVWVKQTNATGSQVILGKFSPGGGSDDVSYAIRLTTGGVVRADYGNGSTAVSTTTYNMTLNTWYQIVYVFNNIANNNIYTYVNGALQSTNTHSFASILNTSTNLYLGSYNNNEFSQFWAGQTGIVSYYNRALTASQIATNYQVSKATYGL
jgi:hypothetical protein